MSLIGKVVDYSFGFIFVILGFIMCLTGIAIFGFQVYYWLAYGEWFKFPLMYLVGLIDIFIFTDSALMEWINGPQSWFGLHKFIVWFLKSIPLSLFLFLLGSFMVGGVQKGIENKYKK